LERKKQDRGGGADGLYNRGEQWGTGDPPGVGYSGRLVWYRIGGCAEGRPFIERIGRGAAGRPLDQ
jgi:hypothetical protein